MSETIAITWTDCKAQRRKVEYRERRVGGYVRIEMHKREGCWQPVGSEIVSNVGLEVDDREVSVR